MEVSCVGKGAYESHFPPSYQMPGINMQEIPQPHPKKIPQCGTPGEKSIQEAGAFFGPGKSAGFLATEQAVTIFRHQCVAQISQR